jgi:CRISPR-associated endonuclease/helicase Cas3
LLDVAATVGAILDARPLAAARASRLLGLSPADAKQLLVALASLHDLGKFTPAFQAKAPEYWPRVLGEFAPSLAVRRAHTDDGFLLWNDTLEELFGDSIWHGESASLNLLAPAVFGHHGSPAGSRFNPDPAKQIFGARGLQVAIECASTVLELLCPRAISGCVIEERTLRIASWWVSGLITIADWIGSHEEWFPYTAPDPDDHRLARYWERAQRQAKEAVRAAGVMPAVPSDLKSFEEITKGLGPPTPVQQWASFVELPHGPALFVIEDATGSGKTEAAQMLVHRLIAGGRADGAFWAMPTMATANAMYGRQCEALEALYDSSDGSLAPSLVLSHGQQRLHEKFRDTVLYPIGDALGEDPNDDEDQLDSRVICAAFLADDRRAAFLADIGAGTIDQAMLGVLPSRFNTIRLFGMADKVLIIDEAHSYDAYMTVELKELLRFQAALGGTAIVLSATLSQQQRQNLVD